MASIAQADSEGKDTGNTSIAGVPSALQERVAVIPKAS